MRNYIERAQDFIQHIYPFIEDVQYDVYNLGYAIEQYNQRFNRKVLFRHGISRIALITSDYVIKYNFDEDEVACVGGCEDEMRIYSIAKREGFAYLFAEITRFYYGGKNFYIMPRIRGIGSHEWDYADAFMTDEEEQFCNSLHITDLHCNNYGFRKGHVCLVDYACGLEEERTEYNTSSSSSSSSSSFNLLSSLRN